ncbi:retinol dehydrogenase 13 isoform X1 [Callorhinchus milii]|uniref:Retinol dehydrogenase 11-like protein n=2 Tax=Callorhinchus milii TaxID=7868 RepID=V9KYW1_CALMI|nr:retinol dehydrogenase 13 isoform X1 [Callorhinchus milii]
MEWISLICHPLWFLVSVILIIVVKWQRKGYWKPQDCPVRLTGKTVIVTGANTGIGKQIAMDLARRNARVILACRNLHRGRNTEQEIRHKTGNHNVHLRILDTSSLQSVRRFSEQINKEEKQLDILINNAGASGLKREITSDGLELTFATNCLGPFLLTNLLLEKLKLSTLARIVNVSSLNHARGKIDFTQMTGENFPPFDSAYNNTKLMNILHTMELSNHLQHSAVTVNAVNPGVVLTEVMRNYNVLIRSCFNIIGFFCFKSPQEGAVSTIYCAVSKELENVSGKYIDSDCSLRLPSPTAQDASIAGKLWDISERLTANSRDK